MVNQPLLPYPPEIGGICGIHGSAEAARQVCFGLYALQHRGQEGAGIVAGDGLRTWQHKGAGLVAEVFTEMDLKVLKGHIALGQVQNRVGAAANVQPFTAYHQGRAMSVACNGRLADDRALREMLQQEGAIFHSDIECEVVAHLLARRENGVDLAVILQAIFAKVNGAFSMLLMLDGKLVAIRDQKGFRPLSVGRLRHGGYMVTSETCAFDLLEAEYLREVEPGEILVIDSDGLHSTRMAGEQALGFCLFEQISFARPDSNVFGINVYQSRKRIGEMLARECRIEADLVMPFPDSGNCAAIGYSLVSGIPFEMGMIRNHYADRNFVQPGQILGELSDRVKLNPVRSLLAGKKVIIIEDSMISGDSAKIRIRALRECGVREVHLLVGCPPLSFPCPHGIRFPPGSLLAYGYAHEEIRRYLELDTLRFLSLDGLFKAIGGPKASFCKACFDGTMPTALVLGAENPCL